jgi:hypothetical protein
MQVFGMFQEMTTHFYEKWESLVFFRNGTLDYDWFYFGSVSQQFFSVEYSTTKQNKLGRSYSVVLLGYESLAATIISRRISKCHHQRAKQNAVCFLNYCSFLSPGEAVNFVVSYMILVLNHFYTLRYLLNHLFGFHSMFLFVFSGLHILDCT